jgi:hypothetical protein
VRRETGKSRRVEVRHSEGVANRTGPEGYFDMYGDVEVINKRVSEYLSIHALHKCRWLASSEHRAAVTRSLECASRMLNLELRFARIVTTGNNSI